MPALQVALVSARTVWPGVSMCLGETRSDSCIFSISAVACQIEWKMRYPSVAETLSK